MSDVVINVRVRGDFGLLEELPVEVCVLQRDESGTRGEIMWVDQFVGDDLEGRVSLGRAMGKDIVHCLYLGTKYQENFLQDVAGFYVLPGESVELARMRSFQPGSVEVEFYGKK